jgi:hypothetical protein
MQILLPNPVQNRSRGRLLRLALLVLSCPVGMQWNAITTCAQGTAAKSGGPREVQTASKSRAEGLPSAQWPGSISENAPTTQPRVSFEDGQLSINANNSSLSDILMAVRAVTGADVDLPGGVSGERVTAQLGPGPARRVLSDLLGWSNYDYIIQGSDTDPLAIHSVILMVRIKGTNLTPGAAIDVANRHSAASPARQVPEAASTPADAPEAQAIPEEPASAPASVPVASSDGGGIGPSPEVVSRPMVSGGGAGAGSNAGKSPAEMVQELQQLYQQRRVLQEQQNSGQKPPPGT